MKLLIAKDLNLLSGIFLREKRVNFWLLGRIFFPYPGFPTKGQGKGEQPTPGGYNKFVIFLVRREMPDV